ncbi:MAG TPA: CDP-alcohol phosphatidyltransferase family protein [Microlunatus sp.]|nr:CDP-alcohol phosphatidyltransferase family protein [Microlunatus sp.]
MRRSAGVDTDRVLTLPNVLSALRLAGVPFVLWLILGPQADVLAVVVLAVSGATDWLDGWIARRWHQRSRIGQVLDPLADRLYILATVLGLALRGLIPWWLVIVLVARDVVIASLVPALRTRGYSTLPVHFLGKAATFCLLYAFPLILLGAAPQDWAIAPRVLGWAFALWGTGLYWYAALLYVHQAYGLLRSTPPIRGRRRAGRPSAGAPSSSSRSEEGR